MSAGVAARSPSPAASPRAAYRWDAEISRSQGGVTRRQKVLVIAPVRPGDTITISDRWF
jgi:hypothetical protein